MFQALDFGVANFGNKPKWSFDISSARISIRIISPRDSWYLFWWFQPIPGPMGSETWGNHGKPKKFFSANHSPKKDRHDLENAATTFGQSPIENTRPGERLHFAMENHFFMGKLTISMAMFNCYVSSPEGSVIEYISISLAHIP